MLNKVQNEYLKGWSGQTHSSEDQKRRLEIYQKGLRQMIFYQHTNDASIRQQSQDTTHTDQISIQSQMTQEDQRYLHRLKAVEIMAKQIVEQLYNFIQIEETKLGSLDERDQHRFNQL